MEILKGVIAGISLACFVIAAALAYIALPDVEWQSYKDGISSSGFLLTFCLFAFGLK